MNRNLCIVDCACGVGYYAVKRLVDAIQRLDVNSEIATKLLALNGPNDGILNQDCGSEIVQKKQCAPKWWNPDVKDIGVPYGAAIDGDADRIVFFANSNSVDGFILLDGDQIACLICKYLQQLISTLSNGSRDPVLTLGVVQTAYANGASTQYLCRVLGNENVKIAKTGVKYVHHMAETSNFDISVYFEANGHGTVCFDSNKLTKLLLQQQQQQSQSSKNLTHKQQMAWKQLRLLPLLIHPTVGDALCDILLVDFILPMLS